MPDIEERLHQISSKLQQLLKNYALLQKENDRLKTELGYLKASEKEKDDQLHLLSLRNEVLKISKSNMSEEEKKHLEKTINQYIREIDKCIAFLNE